MPSEKILHSTYKTNIKPRNRNSAALVVSSTTKNVKTLWRITRNSEEYRTRVVLDYVYMFAIVAY